ncbi:MAG: hypothetical protein ACTSRG_10850 [Candidatus Helarchaeota archaeon]
MSSLKPLDLIFKLEEEIERNKLLIMDLKGQFNSGKIDLNQYTAKVDEIDKKNTEISQKIALLGNKITEQEKILKREIEAVTSNFQVDFDPQNITILKIDFYSSVGAYYLVELNCQNFPNQIKFKFPPELTDLIGPPESIQIIKDFPQQPPAHLVEILRKIEEEIMGKSRVDEEVQSLYQEYDVEQPTELSSKLKIHIYSLDAEQFDLDIDLKNFPQVPEIILSPKMEKFIFLDSLKSLKTWNSNSHIADIIREVSAILDRKLRINLEIKLLKEKEIDAVFDTVNNIIHVSLAESKTSPTKYKFDVIIPTNYPSSPPTIRLLSLVKDEKRLEFFNSSINYFIMDWFPAARLADFFQELKEEISESSKFVCNVCKQLVCPYCSKNVAGSIPGVSGELECQMICPHCKRIFHLHCWKEYVKYSQKCPICQKHISVW